MATACSGCGAIKIYTNGHVHGFFNLVMQIPMGGFLMLLAVWCAYLMESVMFLIFAAILAAYVIWTIMVLFGGPRWLKSA